MKTIGELKKELNALMEYEGDYEQETYKGIKYEVKRNKHLKHWCGYIYLNQEIKNEDYNHIIVHGGVTHMSYKKGYFVYGFDCMHLNDLYPYMLNYFEDNDKVRDSLGTYRIKEYAINECKFFIDQVVALREGN